MNMRDRENGGTARGGPSSAASTTGRQTSSRASCWMATDQGARLIPTAPASAPPLSGHHGRTMQADVEGGRGTELPSAVQSIQAEAEDVRSGEVAAARSAGSKRRASICDVIGLDPTKTAWTTGDSGGGKAAQNPYEMDLRQFSKLSEQLNFKLTKKRLKDEFTKLASLCDRDDGKADGRAVEDWVRYQSQQHRREARKVARSLFVAADDDNSGYLVREEVADLTEELKAIYPEYKIDPPLDLDVDFAVMDKDGAGHVSWDEFDKWWAHRSGDTEPTCPVLPEAMVSRLDHMLELQGHNRDGSGWSFLRPRLLGLVTLQRWWGGIGDLYSGSDESLFGKDVLPKWIRHPEARSTQAWDIASFFLIIWVAFVVPFRLGFEVDVDIKSVAFVMDAVVDTFFLVDVFLQFRTAYLLPSGFLEVRFEQIAKKYMASWFLVDLVASLPLTYVSLIYQVSAANDGGPSDNLSFAKTLRMVRLAKMLRVARLKRIVGRHASLVEFSAYMNSLVTFFIILYISHLLACTWYWLGTSYAESVGEGEINGWVIREDSTFNLTSASAGVKYATSIYTIFKLGDSMARTPGEQWFAFTSELVISLIYGALAGVMSTLMMAGSIGEQEYLVKLAQLKAWMKAKSFSAPERMRLMSLFSANHQSASFYDEKEVLSYLPLDVSRDLSLHLYAAIMSESPLFSNLGTELMLCLCQIVIPQGYIEGNLVYEEGKIGDEMFFVVRGECEVLKGAGANRERLGFIGQGGFFGENCIIEAVGRSKGSGAGKRIRTMRATTDSELAMLRSGDVLKVCSEFPELELRLQSFRKAGLKLSQKGEQAKQARRYKADMAASQAHAAEMKDEGERLRPAPAEADTGGASVSEAVLSRLLAAHTSTVMKAVQGIDAKLSEQQAVLEAQQEAQAELDRKLAAMVEK